MDALKTDGTLSPSPVVQVNVVQNAGPAIHMTALGDLACNTHHSTVSEHSGTMTTLTSATLSQDTAVP